MKSVFDIKISAFDAETSLEFSKVLTRKATDQVRLDKMAFHLVIRSNSHGDLEKRAL